MRRVVHAASDIRVIAWALLVIMSAASMVHIACNSNGTHEGGDPRGDVPCTLTTEGAVPDLRPELPPGGDGQIEPPSKATGGTPLPARSNWQFVRYGYGIQPYETLTRYATCYPDHPSDIDKRKPYANRKFPFIPPERDQDTQARLHGCCQLRGQVDERHVHHGQWPSHQ